MRSVDERRERLAGHDLELRVLRTAEIEGGLGIDGLRRY
jgi:hypothetical protein